LYSDEWKLKTVFFQSSVENIQREREKERDRERKREGKREIKIDPINEKTQKAKQTKTTYA
jgi:hypothetical protein